MLYEGIEKAMKRKRGVLRIWVAENIDKTLTFEMEYSWGAKNYIGTRGCDRFADGLEQLEGLLEGDDS